VNAQQIGFHRLIGKKCRDPEGRVGILTDVLRGTAFLRPERGGKEWTVPLEDVQQVPDKAEDADALSARVADANKRSRGEL
jgi:hypothetical protein